MEKENFFKVAEIILNVIPKNLCQLFMDKWNIKFPNNSWDNTSESGKFLLSQRNIQKPKDRFILDHVNKGDIDQWDPTVLFWIFLYSQLDLIDPCRSVELRAVPLLDSEYIDMVRKIRNEFFAHAKGTSLKSDHFKNIMDNLMTETKFGGKELSQKIENILKSPIETNSYAELQDCLDRQKIGNEKLNEFLKELAVKLEDVEQVLKENTEGIQELKIETGKTSEAVGGIKQDVQMLKKRPANVIQENKRIEYHGPCININQSACGSGSVRIGNIQQGGKRTYKNVGNVINNASGNIMTGPVTFGSASQQGAATPIKQGRRIDWSKLQLKKNICCTSGCAESLDVEFCSADQHLNAVIAEANFENRELATIYNYYRESTDATKFRSAADLLDRLCALRPEATVGHFVYIMKKLGRNDVVNIIHTQLHSHSDDDE